MLAEIRKYYMFCKTYAGRKKELQWDSWKKKNCFAVRMPGQFLSFSLGDIKWHYIRWYCKIMSNQWDLKGSILTGMPEDVSKIRLFFRIPEDSSKVGEVGFDTVILLLQSLTLSRFFSDELWKNERHGCFGAVFNLQLFCFSSLLFMPTI